MKKLMAIIGICLMASISQANSTAHSATASSKSGQGQTGDSQKHFDPEKLMAMINEALSKRQEQAEKASSKGNADVAAAIQKIIADLNAMKTALGNKDKAAFKTANEQREKDREALQAMWKSEKSSGTSSKGTCAKSQSRTCKSSKSGI